MRIPSEPSPPSAVRTGRRVLLAGLLSAAVLGRAGSALADPMGDLEKGYSAYVAHKYDDAEARLRALLDPHAPPGAGLKNPDSVADARMYLGAVLLAEGKKEEAGRVFEQLLLDKPDYQPDSLRVSLQATDALIDARTRLREKLATLKTEEVRQAQEAQAKAEGERRRAALRLEMLERLASEKVVVERGSRWEALVPFGVGQFQNGQEAIGWVFLASESLLALGSGAGAALSLYDAAQASDAFSRQDATAPKYQQRAQLAAGIGNLFAAGFALVAIAGIVHAEATFVPETVHVEKRVLPPLSLAPMATPLVQAHGEGTGGAGGGAIVGVRGRF